MLISGEMSPMEASRCFFDIGLATFITADCEEILAQDDLSPELRRATRRIKGVAARRATLCDRHLSHAFELALQAAAAEVEAVTPVN